MIVTKNGEQYEFFLDIDSAIEMEEQTGFNIFEGMSKITTEGGHISLAGLNSICKAILGYKLSDLIRKGFTIPELAGENGIVLKVMEESGFISAQTPSPTSALVEEASPTE